MQIKNKFFKRNTKDSSELNILRNVRIERILIFLKKFLTLLVCSINLIPWYLSIIIPKDNLIWLFGAWNGEKYSDNSKYFFEFVIKNKPEIRAIWLSRDKRIVKKLRKAGCESYLAYSIKGYYYSIKSSFAFYVVGKNDINSFIKYKYSINLWHGNPLKKIGYDNKYNAKLINNTKKKLLVQKLFPFLKNKYFHTKIVASSAIEAKVMSSAFSMGIEDVITSGLPRNDAFFIKKDCYDMYRFIYMPTYRDSGLVDLGGLFSTQLDIINAELDRNKLFLDVKLHYRDLEKNDFDNLSNVKFIKDESIGGDIYSVLGCYDGLITDFSSIFFDFLLLDRPIIFAPFDLADYISHDRELYYSYDDVTPGPKCLSWSEIINWMVKFKNDQSLFSKERESAKNRFHSHQDGNFCERLYNEILKSFPVYKP